MTTDLAVPQSNALDLLNGSGITGDGNYIAAPAYFSSVWKKSGDAAQVAATAAGLKVDSRSVFFAVTKGGAWEFLNPFEFYLIKSEKVFTLHDRNGKTIRAVTAIPPGDPQAGDFKEGYIVLGIAVQGTSLIPFVATLGRFKGGMARAIKTARLSAQNFAKADLSSKGPAYAYAATIKATPFRVLFTLSGTVEEGKDGTYVLSGATQRPAVEDDYLTVQEADLNNPESPTFRDFQECVNVYEALNAKVRKGWSGEEAGE